MIAVIPLLLLTHLAMIAVIPSHSSQEEVRNLMLPVKRPVSLPNSRQQVFSCELNAKISPNGTSNAPSEAEKLSWFWRTVIFLLPPMPLMAERAVRTISTFQLVPGKICSLTLCVLTVTLATILIKPCLLLGTEARMDIKQLIMPSKRVTGEVYCFPHCKLIFSFGGRVTYHSKGLWEFIPKSIKSVCLYHDHQTNSWTLFSC